MLSDASLRFAEALTAATMGVDRLYQAEQDRLNPDLANEPPNSMKRESLVAVALRPDLPVEQFSDYTAARERLSDLARQAAALPEADRRLYYAQACGSVGAFAAWRQGALPFAEQMPAFLHVPPEPASDASLDEYRSQLRDLLTSLGYTGDLKAQSAAWEAKNRVPADEVEGVMNELMAEGWERAQAMYALPEGDGMRAVTERGAAYNARCDILGRRVYINVDPVLTRPGLKHLVAHECYPGHYVQFHMREKLWAEGKAGMDGLMSCINHASSCTFEGIADAGIWFMDWVQNDDERVALLMAEYRGAIGTGAAWRLHGEGQSADQVREWLTEQSLVGGEGWVANRMRFFSLPHRTALIWSYWRGDLAVADVWRRVPAHRRRAFWDYIYGRLHSPQSIAMFDEGMVGA